MTKRPGEFEPREPLTKAEREARKVFRQVEATKAMAEHEQAGRAFNETVNLCAQSEWPHIAPG
jgi:hypothetical protein